MTEQQRRAEAFFEWPVVAAALLVVPTMALEASSAHGRWQTLGSVLDWVIWSVFVAELAVFLILPGRGRWLREHPLEVAIVLVTPPFLPSSLQLARILRLLRLLRLLPALRLVHRVFTLEGVRLAALIAFLTLVGGGTAFSSVEKNVSTWDGIWWAASTMTTVGYGDVVPHTTAGRVIGLTVMFIGIGFGTIVIGAVAQRFVGAEIREEVAALERAESDIEAVEAQLVAELRAMGERLVVLETMVKKLRTARV